MKILSLLSGILLPVLLQAQMPAAEELVFKADFDSPLLVAGESLEVSLAPGGLVPGKFGNGYFFERAARNFLDNNAAEPNDLRFFKPEGNTRLNVKDGTLIASGKGFSLAETPCPGTDGYYHAMTAFTGSCFVKGPKGTKVTLSVHIAPWKGTDYEKKMIFKRYEKNRWTSSGEYKDKFLEEKTVPGTFTLTGDWQRIAAYAECDVRTGKDRMVSMKVAMDGGNEIAFRKFQLEQTMLNPYTFYTPTRWLPGKTSRPAAQSGLVLINQNLQTHFPVREGTVSFFVKVPEDKLFPSEPGAFFGFAQGWRKPMWLMRWNRNLAGNEKETIYPVKGTLPSGRWVHLALTWNESESVYYIDGVKNRSVKRSFQDFGEREKYFFTIGASRWGEEVCDAAMDEFLIFNRALGEPEIKALKDAANTFPVKLDLSFRVNGLDVKPFFRNDPNAAVSLNVFSDQSRDVVFAVKSLREDRFRQSLKQGWNAVRLPFHPALYTPGKYTFALTVFDSSGKKLFGKDVPYEVKGQLRRDFVKLLSWGGEGPVPLEYLLKLGINAVNTAPARYSNEYADNGVFMNLDLRNHRQLEKNNFDIPKTVQESRPDVLRFQNAYHWYGTMLNSEAFNYWSFKEWDAFPVLVKHAQKELGFDPPHQFVQINPDLCKTPDPEVQFSVTGIYEPGRAFRLLKWFRNDGQRLIELNRESAKLVKSIDPDNLTWAEPAMSAGSFKGLDMGASWEYLVSAQEVAGDMRADYARVHGAGKLFQPTLTMYYWVNTILKGNYNGKTSGLPRSIDELTSNCWLALGAVSMHDLCFFNIYAWYDAEHDAKEYLPVKGVSDGFGKFVKQTFYPATLLLRDSGEPPAKVALLIPEQISYYSEKSWNYQRVSWMWCRMLSQHNIHYDVLYDANLEGKDLSSYHTVIVPMASRIARPLHEKLLKAAGKSRIVTDSYCLRNYPNGIQLEFTYQTPAPYEAESYKHCEEFVRKLAVENTGRSFSAEGEKGPVLYYERLVNGRRYFVVVNNHWTTGPLSEYAVEKRVRGLDYKPYGVPQKVKVSLTPGGDGTMVCEFGRPGVIPVKNEAGKLSFETELGPGQGRVYCVMPETFGEMKLVKEGSFRRGETGIVRIELKTGSGKEPGGRQILFAEVFDGDGKRTDESGWVILENGYGRIPVRVALNSAKGKWNVCVSDMTAGQKKQCSFEIQ